MWKKLVLTAIVILAATTLAGDKRKEKK